MQLLNLPPSEFRLRKNKERDEIFDQVRKKFVALTPEEWVRQHFVNFLVTMKNIPPSLIGIEVPLVYNRLKKRGDIVVWNRKGRPVLIIECKAPSVNVTQDVFHQVAVYNMAMNVDYIAVTNGMDHYVCRIDHAAGSYAFIPEIPSFDEL